MSPEYGSLSRSHASTRVSLRWLPEPPSENTETLVLTVGEWYVDLRVDKASGILDWAIAGQCLRKDINPRRVVFTHTIDSHGNFNVSDPCPFISLPNGYDLETGAMPRPGVPGTPVTEYEEIWRYLSKREIGMDQVEGPVAWILESDDDDDDDDDDDAGHRIKTFLAHIEGRYLALQQKQIHGEDRSGDSQGKGKIIGGEVSARSEEFVHGGWRVKHAFGPDHDDLPSISLDFEGLDQRSWDIPGQKVTVRGRRYIVRAFDSAEKIPKPTEAAKI